MTKEEIAQLFTDAVADNDEEKLAAGVKAATMYILGAVERIVEAVEEIASK